ncbi:MAG: TauD/TfdA family dioxygenase [Pseudomonadota bacterium]
MNVAAETQPALPRTDYEHFHIRTLTPHIGAEVQDIDLSRPLTDAQLVALRQAWIDWKLLVFREQTLTRDQHKAFGRRFGDLHVHPMTERHLDDNEILTIRTTAKSPYTAGDAWHTDVTCDAVPPMGSMLYVTETPECGGGDTLFADMYLAYELLSESMQNYLATLTAVHDGAKPYVGSYKSTPPEGGYPRNEHPIVVTHPESGRKLLYVNSGFTTHIKGLRKPESEALLNMLYRHIDSTPKLYCRVEWRPGTLTFWDNRCTQHHAVWDYYPHSRYGERVSVVDGRAPAA